MAVSRRLRYEILRRDGHACRYCGAKAPDTSLTVDHVVPVALSGTDDADNLVAACTDCNAGKSATTPDAPLVASVADDALRWARAMAAAAELQRAQRGAADQFVATFDEMWQGWFPDTHEQYDWHRDSGWRATIVRFRDAGLDVRDLDALLDDVMRRSNVPNGRIWRYFCGACWTAIRSRQDLARDLIDED